MKITWAGTLLAASTVASQCGTREYDPYTHVCNNDRYICPILSGEPLSSCGESCYSHFEYSCDNGKDLVPRPAIQKPFRLVTYNLYTSHVHGFDVHACNQRLYFGNGSATCTYCPDLPQFRDVCNGRGLKNETILLVGSGTNGFSLAAQVPGGQRIFVGPEGGLNYTRAHSLNVPDGAQYDGLIAYQDGAFADTKNGFGWAACGQLNGLNDVPVWDIVAPIEAVTLWDIYDACVEVKLLVVELDLKDGVYIPWQYE